MLTITQLPNKRLAIKCNYYYHNRLHNIPTAYFDPNIKQWIIEPYMLGTLEREFHGELVYKTPRWIILNEPMPDMSEMYKISDTSIQCPALKLKPFDYQDYGVRFMIDKILQNNMVLNADSVGLGKTLQTIGTLKWFIDNRGFTKILIICKKSIKRQWKEEIEKFTDLQKDFTLIYTGETAAKRKKAYKDFQNANKGILITNYHSFLNDTDIIKSLDYDMVIIDEAHVVKSKTGKLNNNIASAVQGKPVIFLTGTPVMSKPEDIFGIIQIADPDYFGPWKEFSKEYLVYAMTNFGYNVIGAKNLDKLREKVQNILIRRTEYEVSVQLPEVNIIKKMCSMDYVQEKLLSDIALKQQEILDNMNKCKDKNGKVFNPKLFNALDAQSKALIAARQAASTDPRTFLLSPSKMFKEGFGAVIPKSYKGSDKSESIVDLVEDIVDSGNKVILFSKFRTTIVLLANDIQSKLKQNVLLYTGSEDGEIRDNNIDLFNNSSDYNILLGTDALAEGVNLQVAKYVINIDQPDTYAIKTQRIGRVRRVSSKFNNVIVYDMITEDGASVRSKDVERLENIEKNKDLTDALVNIDESQRQALIKAQKS